MYKIMSTFRPGQGTEGKKMWFPKLTGTSQLTLRDVARELARQSTLSESDVYAVIYGLVELIPDKLKDGYTIKLNDLGTFRLHARVTTADSPDQVTVRNIKELRLSFKPDNTLKKELQNAKIKKEKE
ncbi:MAG: HU family DNA-binding protein [Bacteroidota bacterium]|nr:HU family DNA-binding protein [Bacteroidota bacterium]